MKFDFCIGNPPYQEDTNGENKTYSPPVYDKFMEAAFGIAEKVELIHPARFLFNSGSTPKEWNEQMLNNNHFKVLEYESNSSKYFDSVSIMGGIAISYFDSQNDFGIIGVFSPYKEMRSILKKVMSHHDYLSIQKIISIQTRFNLENLYLEYPEFREELGSGGRDSRFEKNIFKRIPLFSDTPHAKDDIRTLGISDGRQRAWKYIPKKFVDDSQENLMSYKTIVSVSNGAAGIICEDQVRILGESVLGEPGDGYTRSFIGIGCFNSRKEAENCQTYLRTKFARIMVGMQKNTQMLNPDVWKYVPQQNFSSSSSIDWDRTIVEIDQQLYKKYDLSQEEIDFIEKHIKEME